MNCGVIFDENAGYIFVLMIVIIIIYSAIKQNYKKPSIMRLGSVNNNLIN